MTINTVVSKLLVGPAVVVDDTVNESRGTSGIQGIVDQIEQADIPILKLSTLPELEQVRHWGGFSMIILDWELFPSDDPQDALPPGVGLTAQLRERNDARVSGFVQHLLDQLYCPIFIVSSLGTDEIHDALISRLSVDAEQLRARVLIKSKVSSQVDFLDSLEAWIRSHPAVYALKSWELGYEKAKRSLFADFQRSSVMWPQILWKTFDDDSVNQHFELAETLNRNLLHRMDPLVFDAEAIKSANGEPSKSSLHDVLHGQAVIPQEKLPSDVLMPGDFFYPGHPSPSPEVILINLTAACDLVPRDGQNRSDIRLRLVKAKLVKDLSQKSSKVQEFIDRERSTSQVLHHLTKTGQPYEVSFSSHYEATWGEVQDARRGRLLPPYITQLQQKFALYLLRPGLPRLPIEFYVP